MIFTIIHLLTCIGLVAASIYWKIHIHEDNSIYRPMIPFIALAGFFGLVILYGYFAEVFVASYSGSIYEVDPLPRKQAIWIAISMLLTVLPFVGLIPYIGSRATALIVIGLAAATPSALSLAAFYNNHQAEQD